MGLSNQQIERYARQIIVPGVGGIAQERLLSSQLMLAGRAADVAPVLAYLVGAGIGKIRLQLPERDAHEQDALIKRSRQLNPEVLVNHAAGYYAGLNLVLALDGDLETTEAMTSPRLARAGVPMIFSRLDEPAIIAVLPGAPPCLLCADADLLVRSTERGENAGFVAMIAATEAFKLLANIAPASTFRLLQFSGFACTTRHLAQKPSAKCICSAERNLVTGKR
jgi:sulfur-carrier protein adenylyltransferase/sulfurtransferase